MLANYGEIWQLIARAAPDAIAIETVGGGTLTYASFDDQAARLATFWRDNGVRAGDKVTLLLYNRAEWLVSYFAALKLGAAPVPVNFRYRAREIDAILRDSDAVALVYPDSLADVVADLQTPAEQSIVRVQVADQEDAVLVDGATRFTTAVASAPLPYAPLPEGELFLYTGGSTGQPKGVVWGVAEMLDVQTYPAYGALGIVAPTSLAEAVAIAVDPGTPRPRTMPLAPFMHGTALTTALNTLVVGGTMVIVPSPRFEPETALRGLFDYGVTRLVVAGDSVARRVLEALSPDTRLPALTSVMSSGMRFSDDVKARLHALGNVVITDLLAASEGGPFAMAVTENAEQLPARLRLTPKTILVDASLSEVPTIPGAVGLLAFGGSQPKGYYKDPAKTATTFVFIDGRRHVMPGDLARVLDDGSIELLGRGSSVINTGGEKIYPTEVEEVLMTHPLVTDAVVFGVPDLSWGEVVSAAVAVDENSSVTAGQLIEYVGKQLASYKKPKKVLVRASLDRSPSGKADLLALKEAILAMSDAAS